MPDRNMSDQAIKSALRGLVQEAAQEAGTDELWEVLEEDHSEADLDRAYQLWDSCEIELTIHFPKVA